MASAANIRAGGAYVEIGADSTPADREFAKFERKLASVSARISNTGRALTTAALGSAFVLAAPTKFALDAIATSRKFQAVFGENARAADAFALSLARALNRGADGIRNSLATYQALFKGLGFGSAEAAKLSQATAKAALDFGAFFKVAEGESQDRFIAALSGSVEVLDQFGINIRQAAIDQELLSRGIKKTAATASESEKTLARLSLIQKALRNQGAEGISLRSVGDTDQKLTQLASQSTKLAASLGTALLPAVSEVAEKTTSLVKSANDLAEKSPKLVGTVGSLAIYGTAAGLAIGGAGLALGKITSIAALTVPAIATVTRWTLLSRDAMLAFAAAQSGAFVFGRVARFRDAILAAGGATQLLGARLLPLGLFAGKFLLIAAAAAAVTLAIYKLTNATAELSDTAERASRDLRANVLTDSGLIDRLKALAGAQTTTSTTGKEASAILKTLELRYGSLGATVDRTTGRVTGLANALARIAAAQEKAAKSALANELAEAQKNLEALRKEADVYGMKYRGGIPGLAKDVGRTVVGEGPLWGGESSVTKSARDVAKRIEAQLARVADLRRQLAGETVDASKETGNQNQLTQRAEAEQSLNDQLIAIYRQRDDARRNDLDKQLMELREQSTQVRSALTQLAQNERAANGQTPRYIALLNQLAAFEAESARTAASAIRAAEEAKRDARARTIREAIGDSQALMAQEQKQLDAFRQSVESVLRGLTGKGNQASADMFAQAATRSLDNLHILDPDTLKKLSDVIQSIREEIAAGGLDAAKAFSAEQRKAELERQKIQKTEFSRSLARRLADLTGNESLGLKLDAAEFKEEAQKALGDLNLIDPKERDQLQADINSISEMIASGAGRAAKDIKIQFAEGMSISDARNKELQQRIALQIGGSVEKDEAKKQTGYLKSLESMFASFARNIGVESGK